jgi:hypothetical protein
MIPQEIFLKIVRSAIKAPSGHNTQPWLFTQEDDGICIMPDFSRALPIADPDHRELFISLGCAAQTAMITAGHYGYSPAWQIISTRGQSAIKITLRKEGAVDNLELYSFIKPRQTTRNLYEAKPISGSDLTDLKSIPLELGVGLRYFSGNDELKRFSLFITQANAIQMGNPKFKNELIHWMRFSEKEAMQKGDGLYSACSGLPSMGRMLGEFVLKHFVTVKSENKRLLKQLERTSSLAMFTTQSNDIEHWIKTGISLQRFALHATKLNIRHSFLNLPCQIPQVRDRMVNHLGLTSEFPQLLVRLGYSSMMHFSFRRRVDEILQNKC